MAYTFEAMHTHLSHNLMTMVCLMYVTSYVGVEVLINCAVNHLPY